MNSNDREEFMAELLRAGHDENLPPDSRHTLEELASVADHVWVSMHGAPALVDDPVAALLGLVPDTAYSLEGRALGRARMNARLKVGDLASRLSARGWEIAAGDVFRWENRSAADVSPALIKAIAEEIGSPVERIVTSRIVDSANEVVTAVRQSPLFQSLVQRWAALQGVPLALASSALESRMVATAHRGEHPDAEQLLQSLDALVSTLEQATESQ